MTCSDISSHLDGCCGSLKPFCSSYTAPREFLFPVRMAPGIPARGLQGNPIIPSLAIILHVSYVVAGPGTNSSCVDTCDVYHGIEGSSELGSCSSWPQSLPTHSLLLPFLCVGDLGPGHQALCPHVDTGYNMPDATLSLSFL